MYIVVADIKNDKSNLVKITDLLGPFLFISTSDRLLFDKIENLLKKHKSKIKAVITFGDAYFKFHPKDNYIPFSIGKPTNYKLPLFPFADVQYMEANKQYRKFLKW